MFLVARDCAPVAEDKEKLRGKTLSLSDLAPATSDFLRVEEYSPTLDGVVNQSVLFWIFW